MVAVRGLRTNSNLSPTLVPSVKFEPTIGIAAARLDKLGLNIRSFREPLGRSVRLVMVPSIRRNFEVGGRPPWEPLSEATLHFRQSRNIAGSQPLALTGKLRRVASQINIWTVTPYSAVINDLPDKVFYGKIHQAGYEGKSMRALIRKHGGNIAKASAEHSAGLLKALSGGGQLGGRTAASIPARPFLFIQPEDEEAITLVFAEWLEERIAHAWAKGVR